MPVAQRLLNTTDRAFRLVVSDSWLAGLLRTQGARADRGVRDEPRARAAARVSRRLADRHPLPQERAVEIARRPARRRAARRRPLPVAAAEVRARTARSRICSGRSTISRFNLIVIGQPSPPEGYAAPRRAGARPRRPRRPRQRRGAGARADSRSPPSISCAPTAMSDFAGRASKPKPSSVTYPNGSEFERRRGR